MDAGRRARRANDGDEKEGSRVGASFHADQHEQHGYLLVNGNGTSTVT